MALAMPSRAVTPDSFHQEDAARQSSRSRNYETTNDLYGRRLFSGPIKSGVIDLRAHGAKADNHFIIER